MNDGTRSALRGVVAIPVTPFGVDGGIDEDGYRASVRRMTDGGIGVLTPGGNTGEYYSLSPVERRRVVGLTREAAPDALIVAGVGLDARTAAADALTAVDAGAHCVMVHQPVHPYQSIDGWVAYHAAIAEAVPGVGLIPYVKDDRVDATAMRALLAACPEVVAVKYAVADPVRFAGLVHDTRGLDLAWLCGLAEAWAPFFAPGGAEGFTSGLATIDPARSLRMLDALRAGDHAATRAEWTQLRGFEQLRANNRSADNVSVVKEALAQLGLCRRDVRPPIGAVSAAVAEEVGRILAEWGLEPQTPSGTAGA